MTSDATKDPFNDELLKDIIPFVEANYRKMEATVEVDPDTIGDFEGFDEDVGIDLDGLGFNVGVAFRFGG